MRLPRRRPLPDPPPIDITTLLPPFAPVDAASEWLFGLRRLGIRPGLSGIRELLARLGHPEERVPCIVVAGTNGKGTASIYLAALCRSAGLRTALYTSPHLLSATERIEIDGRPIPREDLASLVDEHRDLVDSLRTTFFESLTGLALLYFARRGVDVAVLEAGLGGRLDATNVVEKKAVVLTSIGLDHQELLGDTLSHIAREKLGLADKGIPFYLPRLPRDIHALALEDLANRGAVPVQLAPLVDPVDRKGAESLVVVRGLIQRQQAAEMTACYRDLASRLDWPAADPAAAFRGLRLPCRYETYGEDPELILDTAHNGQALRAVLGQWSARGDRRHRILILAAMRGKSIEDILPLAVRAAGSVVVTAPRWYRAVPVGELAASLEGAARQTDAVTRIVASSSVRDALEIARSQARVLPGDPSTRSVLLTGSNFVVAEALDRLGVDDLASSPRSPLWDSGQPLRHRRNTGREMAVS